MTTQAQQLETAQWIAMRAHEGQLYGGLPYYENHVCKVAQRVAEMTTDVNTLLVAYLHDVLEDSNVTAQDLLEAGMPRSVVSGVVAITHLPGMSYMEYVMGAGDHELARVVKYCDMKENFSNNPSKRKAGMYEVCIEYFRIQYGFE